MFSCPEQHPYRPDNSRRASHTCEMRFFHFIFSTCIGIGNANLFSVPESMTFQRALHTRITYAGAGVGRGHQSVYIFAFLKFVSVCVCHTALSYRHTHGDVTIVSRSEGHANSQQQLVLLCNYINFIPRSAVNAFPIRSHIRAERWAGAL